MAPPTSLPAGNTGDRDRAVLPIGNISAPPPRTSADRFVQAAQALVILAFAVGVSIHIGVNPWFSATMVGALLLMLAGINRFLADRKNHKAAPEQRIKRMAPGAVPVAARVPAAQRLAPQPRQQRTPDSAPNTPPPTLMPRSHELRAERPLNSEYQPRPQPNPRSAPQYPQPGALTANGPAVGPRATDAAPVHGYGPASGPMHGYWSASPGQPRLVPAAPPPLSQANELRETDVEIIQQLIRKLADDVNASDALMASVEQTAAQRHQVFAPNLDVPPPLPAAQIPLSASPIPLAASSIPLAAAPLQMPLAPPPIPVPQSIEPPPLPLAHQPLASNPVLAQEAAIEKSLEALRVTADSMRSPSDVVFRTSGPPTIPNAVPLATAPSVAPVAPPPLPQSGPSRATQLAEAISAGRLDVMLEPILGLDDRDARHFEVSIRLRDASGQVLDSNTRATDLSGTGLLPLFDAARLHRTLNVAAKLSERGKIGSVFSTYSADALDSRAFLADASEAMHRRDPGAGQLVLTFDQADVRSFGHPQWDAIDDMRALGFRFAMAGITDFDIDFEALAGLGFEFAKLDAGVFLDGLMAPSGLIPPDDVCRHLSTAGMTLIVEHIDDADKLARIFGFGVLFGQGQLFGGPRALKSDAAAAKPANQAVA